MNEDLHTLSGAYALHALPEHEERRFEEHMARCEACLLEVRGLRETAARLGLAAAEPPPPALRSRVLARIAEVRQEPPVVPADPGRAEPYRPGGDTGPQTGPQGPASWDAAGSTPPGGTPPGGLGLAEGGPAAERLDTTWPHPREAAPRYRGPDLPPGPPADLAAPGGPGRAARTGPDGGGTVAGLGRARRAAHRVPRVSWGTRISAAVATISTAAAVALGYLTWDAHRQLGQVTAHSQAVAAILAAPDARTVVRPVSGGGSATIVRSKSAGRLVFTASGLANLPASRAYELWLMGPDGPRPAGLLQRAADGTVLPIVALTLAGEEQIGLTVEPAGGSARPTTQPILLTRLPGA